MAAITYVIPCSGAKLDRPGPARDMYRGQMFRHTLANVERMAAMDTAEGRGEARVLVLSARYGLIELDTVVEPYEQQMGAPGSVTAETIAAQALALGIDWGAEVYALLPRPYLARLDAALRTLYVYVQDVYEATRGIGEQRRVNAIVGRPSTVVDPLPADGLQVWVGGDVNAFWWGLPILVSYARLREATVLPVASTQWVCDSRGFAEIGQHGRWTIPPHRYAEDLDRYHREIGGLAWAAPQDWPCGEHLLARTGLTEAEHQERTIASVLELRAAVPHLPIITVVTGRTAAGYLRHMDMYRQARVDLAAEPLVVGVGSLVGRTPTDTAGIIRALWAAGLRRMHGFGVKGLVLDAVGLLLESIDSAAWSTEARRRGGECRHGLVAWERNCPQAAREWAQRQRQRASRSAVQEQLPMYGLVA